MRLLDYVADAPTHVDRNGHRHEATDCVQCWCEDWMCWHLPTAETGVAAGACDRPLCECPRFRSELCLDDKAGPGGQTLICEAIAGHRPLHVGTNPGTGEPLFWGRAAAS